MKYTLGEIAAVTGGAVTGPDLWVSGVFTDSRTVGAGPGAMFVAVKGANHDGHAYIGGLYARGTRAFMVEQEQDADALPGAGFVLVGDAVAALQALAADHRSRFGGVVVGITGSNGKTIVKEWAAQLAPQGVKVFRSPRSYNSQTGVPLSLLMMEGDEQVAIIEAGISQKGEMERLERIIRPDVGVITTLGDAHQEGFESLEAKLSEKLKLLRGAGIVIYNSAYENIGRALGSPAVVVDAASNMEETSRVFGDAASRENAAMAVALWDALGYDHAGTLSRLGGLQPVAMRLELKDGIHSSLVVNDSYNSDVRSLSIALDYLAGVAGGRDKVLVLSDILQSGLAADELYSRVAAMVAGAGVALLAGVGAEISAHRERFTCPCIFFRTAEEAAAALGRDEVAGRAVLVKGSRASGLEKVSHALQLRSHTTVLEIDLDAMRGNLNAFRSLLGRETKVMAMVKASGYGNGDHEVASMLQREGVDCLAVAFADEGALLRQRGISAPVVVLNADEDSFPVMVDRRLEPEIYSFRSLEAFAGELRRRSERDYPVHIKLDTGMHRLGFEEKDIDRLADLLRDNMALIRVRSIFAHLAAADDPAHDGFTRSQIALFDSLSRRIMDALPYGIVRHTANSAGMERFPEARFDMCRLGIGLYGIGLPGGMKLRPVSTLRSRIVQVKELDRGQSVGYGRAAALRRPTRTATIPMGYADGLDRHLGEGRWSVSVGGAGAPIIGRICMDTCMIDVTGLDVHEGDEVVIFSPAEGNTVEDMARVLGTIPYEIMTGISSRVKRVFVKE